MVLSLYLNSKCLNEVIILDGDMYGVNPILDANMCGIFVQAPVARLISPYALILFEIIFVYLYVGVTLYMGECKISYFNTINLHPPIHLKLSYLAGQNSTSLCKRQCIDAQPRSHPIRLNICLFI